MVFHPPKYFHFKTNENKVCVLYFLNLSVLKNEFIKLFRYYNINPQNLFLYTDNIIFT